MYRAKEIFIYITLVAAVLVCVLSIVLDLYSIFDTMGSTQQGNSLFDKHKVAHGVSLGMRLIIVGMVSCALFLTFQSDEEQ